MKKAVLSLLLATGFMAGAQECKKYLESNPEDQFSTENVIFSKPVVFSQPTMVDSRTASFRVLDGNRFYFHLTSGNLRDLIFGSDVIITFTNNDDLTLRIEQLERVKEGTESVTHANCRVYSEEDAMLFYAQRIKTINLVGSKQVFDIDEKDQGKIKHGAICTITRAQVDNLNFKSVRHTKLIPDPSGVSFDAGSSSMVIMSGNIKCEYDTDTIINEVPYRVAKPKTIVTSPHELTAQVTQKDGKLMLALMYNKDLGCITTDSYIIFKFKDGSTKTFSHAGEEDCNELTTFLVDVTLYRELFWNNEVSHIRLSYSEYYADLSVAYAGYLGALLRYCF